MCITNKLAAIQTVGENLRGPGVPRIARLQGFREKLHPQAKDIGEQWH
jgi:hypothetical protein